MIETAFCQNGRCTGWQTCRQEMMLSCVLIIRCFLDGLDGAEDVLLQCLCLGLLDELIVGYIRERKPQCLLVGLRFHACCRKDNEKGGDISIYYHVL